MSKLHNFGHLFRLILILFKEISVNSQSQLCLSLAQLSPSLFLNTKYKQNKIQKKPETKYKYNKMQKCKHDKIQNDKIQMKQHKNRTKYTWLENRQILKSWQKLFWTYLWKQSNLVLEVRPFLFVFDSATFWASFALFWALRGNFFFALLGYFWGQISFKTHLWSLLM